MAHEAGPLHLPSPCDVGLVLWDGVELLDLAGPGEVLGVAGGKGRFKIRTLAPSPEPITSQGFLRIHPDGVLGEGDPPHLLVIPGGGSEEAALIPGFIERLGEVAKASQMVFTVCTGALLLARTGLLAGREATTWVGAYGRLRELEPRVQVREGSRWVDNGQILTAAGVSAGIDASLHLVERVLGAEEARKVAAYMEYERRPQGRRALQENWLPAPEANRSRGEFLLAMSYELRTPMNSVIGYSDRLLKSREDPPTLRQREYLEKIREDAGELLQVVNGIQELAKVDAGRVSLNPSPTRVGGLVREVVRDLGGARPKDGVRVHLELPLDETPLLTDASRVRQVLENLVDNAVKFTRKGTVRISLHLDPETREPVRVDVTDTGPGIPPERLESIFRAFEQGGDESDTSFSGAGLGLALARAMARLQGYRIRVTSEVGKGSTFSLNFRPNQGAA